MFDMIGGSLLSMGGSALGSYLNYEGQRDTNAANQRMSYEQMAFQERMSGSAYQRAVRDISAAGLNPAMIYDKGGAGASSPVGAQATMQNPWSSMSANNISSLLNDLTMREKLRAETQEAQARTIVHNQTAYQVRAYTSKAQEETNNLIDQRHHILAEIDRSKSLAEYWRLQSQLTKVNTQLAQYGINTARNESEAADTWFGRNVMPYLKSATDMGSAFGGIGRGASGLGLRLNR